MEIQLQELIDQIKKEGVEAAETKATALLDSAKEEAEKIIADAKAAAEKILLDAKNENERMVQSSEDAIKQAGRNLLLSFRESVARELGSILKEETKAVYSSDALAKLIIKTVECWAEKSDSDDIAVILNSEDLKSLEETIIAGLSDKIKKGVTLMASDNFDGGFRVCLKDTNAYYDYSAESVVEMLSKYLSPKVTKLLKEAE
ncbi:MAG: V-type ATP synthase subunit E [Clostridia bacterium]|nr:V-type ATP synthase subunit E [Clostridia bacterium]